MPLQLQVMHKRRRRGKAINGQMSCWTKKLFEGDLNTQSLFYDSKIASLSCIARVMVFKLSWAKISFWECIFAKAPSCEWEYERLGPTVAQVSFWGSKAIRRQAQVIVADHRPCLPEEFSLHVDFVPHLAVSVFILWTWRWAHHLIGDHCLHVAISSMPHIFPVLIRTAMISPPISSTFATKPVTSWVALGWRTP